MGIDDKEGLDDELVKSLEKLVEEETSVAKAFVDNQKDASAGDKPAQDNADMGKTKVIPMVTPDMLAKKESIQKTGIYNADEVRANIDGRLEADKDIKNEDNKAANKETNKEVNNKEVNKEAGNNKSDNAQSEEKSKITGSNKERPASKKKNIIIIAGVVVAAVLIIGIASGIIIHNKQKESYAYNYEKGMESYKDNDYDAALKCLTKASKLNEGKNNAELKYTIYECYKEKNDTDMQIDTLKDILSFDENNQNAIKALAGLYEKKKDGASLSALIKSYKNKEGYKYLSDYIVDAPKPSVEAGTYDDEQKLQFGTASSVTVYYTLDKSEPTNKSTQYTGTAIEIKKGTTNIKAVAVNSIGVYSEVVELQYVVDYKKPAAPTVTPESGAYSEGQKVTVDNIPEGSKAYYTIDGSVPTSASDEYIEPFDIPTGNNVISVVIIDTHNQSSTVVKRNYVVSKAKSFSYNECLDILKNRLVSDGVVKADGNTTTDGKAVTYVYQPKSTVDSVEMYIVRLDVTDNTATTTKGYYGIGIKNGACYKITNSNGTYSSTEY